MAGDFDASLINLSGIFGEAIASGGTMVRDKFRIFNHNGKKLEGFELVSG